MTRGRVSRADLLMALLHCPDDPARAGALVGYELVPEPEAPRPNIARDPEPVPLDEEPEAEEVTPPSPAPEIKLRTWRVVGYERLESPQSDRPRILERPTLPNRTVTAPRIAPLSPTRSLLVRLRALWQQAQFRGVDLDAVIARISHGEVLLDLPRKRERTWGRHLNVIVDRNEWLIPYWADQNKVVRSLRRLFHRGNASVQIVSDIDQRAFCHPSLWSHGPDTPLLVLGDLGALERGRQGVSRDWLELGERVRNAGGRPQALVPCPVTYLSDELREVWEIIPWEPNSLAVDTESEPTIDPLHVLQILLSPAIRLEPGLVRQMRRLLPDGHRDPALESFFWQDSALIGTSSLAATWHPEAANKLRREFAQPFHPDAENLRLQALQLHETWRRHLPDEVFYEELIGLEAEIAKLGWEKEYQLARDYFHWLAQNPALLTPGDPLNEWCRRWARRISDTTGRDSPAGDDLAQIWGYVHQHDPEPPPPPSWLKTVQLQAFEAVPVQAVVLCEAADGLSVQRLTDGARTQRVVAQLTSHNGLLQTDVPFWNGPTPSFAKRSGHDQYGPWFEFEVERKDAPPVCQRMRWIPAGTFLMGSPDTDKEALEEEKPQHPVTIRHGFWMFDTPCPQELWSAVMPKNPSRFSGARRPVENVSWNDAQAFATNLDALTGLNLSLPTEAEWEYACRAGTTTRYHWGDTITPRHARYWESAEHETADIGSFAPNHWGLYDLHGNVWEWCRDGQRTYSKKAVADPLGNTKEDAQRVFRGGSWYAQARHVRAAYRYAYDPGDRGEDLGFRCVWVQSEAEPVEPVRSDRWDKGASPAQSGGAGAIRIDEHPREIFLTAPRTLVRTDREQMTLELFEQPSWASGFGRDRYGLWADLLIESTAKPHGRSKKSTASPLSGNVIQRLRWIPPGQFRMGSPDSEEGRYDDEGPQHLVTLTDGFWMFDTPCTQAIWHAVMGDNPSRFVDPMRPVEQVDWKQAREFAQRLSVQLPDQTWELPTEAQWEYACRAGTETPTYAGPMKILGDANAPDLDPLAWYGGNSGVDYELADGDALDYLKDKQYAFDKAGTHPVKCKRPNPWGLYDMLGNVWEWCRDGWRKYSEEALVNPEEPTDDNAQRVIRGGSWNFAARYVRAAYRGAGVPGYRLEPLGFRCVWVQSPSRASAAVVKSRDETKPRRDE